MLDHVMMTPHDDVIKWKHFTRFWPFVRGIHRSPVNSSHKGQWRRALMFFFICVWINGCVNNREAGDLRRYRAHYDVRVMLWWHLTVNSRFLTLWMSFALQTPLHIFCVFFTLQVRSWEFLTWWVSMCYVILSLPSGFRQDGVGEFHHTNNSRCHFNIKIVHYQYRTSSCVDKTNKTILFPRWDFMYW